MDCFKSVSVSFSEKALCVTVFTCWKLALRNASSDSQSDCKLQDSEVSGQKSVQNESMHKGIFANLLSQFSRQVQYCARYIEYKNFFDLTICTSLLSRYKCVILE